MDTDFFFFSVQATNLTPLALRSTRYTQVTCSHILLLAASWLQTHYTRDSHQSKGTDLTGCRVKGEGSRVSQCSVSMRKKIPGRDSAFHARSVIIWDVYGTAMIGCSRSFPSDLPPPVPILSVASSERWFFFFFLLLSSAASFSLWNLLKVTLSHHSDSSRLSVLPWRL